VARARATDPVERSAERQDAPVVVRVAVDVEEGVAGRCGDGPDRRAVPALADVDDAFGEHAGPA